MKTILTLTLLLTLTYPLKTISQITANSKIIEVYGEKEVSNLSDNRINYLNYYLDNSYKIREISFEKNEKFTLLSDLLLESKTTNKFILDTDVNNINILKYNIRRDNKLRTAYRLDNTNKVLVFYSNEEFTENFNNYLKINK
jgi:hypothetical protein